jgi:hypothetical protein
MLAPALWIGMLATPPWIGMPARRLWIGMPARRLPHTHTQTSARSLKPRQSLFTLSRTQRRQPLLPKLIEVHSYVVMSKGASTPLQNHIETAGRSTHWTTAGTLEYPKGLIFVLKATPSQGESGNSYLMLDHSHTRAHTHTHLITEIIKWNRSTNV